jgi:hypothetical protein
MVIGYNLSSALHRDSGQEEVIYVGQIIRTEKGGMLVLRNGLPLSPEPSQKIVNHSPDGFSWGFSGSGPAQLALGLLLDVTHDPSLARDHHQCFKAVIIAGLDKDRSWTLTSTAILSWLAEDKLLHEAANIRHD